MSLRPLCLVLTLSAACLVLRAADRPADIDWGDLKPFFSPPPDLKLPADHYRPLLRFDDGRPVTNASEWPARRAEIRAYWDSVLGPWPALLENPRLEVLREERRLNLTQQRVRIPTAPGQSSEGYLLIPDGPGPFPAVLVVFYDPETSVGLAPKAPLRDFALQLSHRGFVTLSIGSPGGDARKPALGQAVCQPLSFLTYVAANCHTALTLHPKVDPRRIGVTGHSYGGKWAMFAACLYEKFAAGAWSDPGIVFDESRPNVNYWEPWYLGLDPALQRKPGIITSTNPRTGAYKQLVEAGHDLHEIMALMAPRPMLVSGGSEDPPERWIALKQLVALNQLLGYENRVAMTNRPTHDPTPESNEVLYRFFQHALDSAKDNNMVHPVR